MSLLVHNRASERGFTFAEMAVATGILALLGLVFYQVLQAGLTLSAKNTAVNAAHEEARQGILRLTRDIHAAVSVPQLRGIDTSTNPPTFPVISSTPSPSASPGATPPIAAAVSFQNIAYGPNWIFQDPGNANLIMIHDTIVNGVAQKPAPGMRIIIPFWGYEDDIAKVTAAGTANHSNVFTVHAMDGVNVRNSPVFGGATYAITYYTDRVMYVVQNGNYVADPKGDFIFSGGQYVQVTPGTGQYHYENGELHYYQQRSTSTNPSVAGTLYWKDTAVVARYISSPKPFSVPLNRLGGSDNKYIKVQLSARDPKSTNRGYIATASLLDTQIDYRSRLTYYQ
jgi:type II secretory pathway component PulJ